MNYIYDVLQRVITVTEENSTSTSCSAGYCVLANYTYDPLGSRTGIAFGNGAATSYNYDGFERLSSLGQTFGGSAPPNVSFGYSYNPANQITSRTVSNSGYISHPGTVSRTYAATGVNTYSNVSGTAYSYDSRQNLTSDGTRAFTYDVENRLLIGSAPTAVALGYDPVGRLQTSTASGPPPPSWTPESR